MIRHQQFPWTKKLPKELDKILTVFKYHEKAFNSTKFKDGTVMSKSGSNDFMKIVTEDLKEIGIEMEEPGLKQRIPVLYGENGEVRKYYDVDGRTSDNRLILEIEGANTMSNGRYAVDLLKFLTIEGTEYAVLAVFNDHFDRARDEYKIIFTSDQIQFKLKNFLLVGY